MTTAVFNRSRRTAALLLLCVAAAIAVVVASIVPGFMPWSASADTHDDMAKAVSSSCSVNYGALDPDDQTKVNPNKETPAAIGPNVDQREEQDVKDELHKRRTCNTANGDGTFDPELTATHYAAWSEAGLTEEKVTYADVDAFRAKIIADPTLYGKTVSELESLENASAFSTKSVSAGNWSVYAEGDGKGNLTTKIGRSSHDGTVAVFKHGNTTIEYRLECGFQVLRESQFPGVKACAYNDCGPKPQPKPTPKPPTSTPPTTTPPTGCTSNCSPTPPTCPPGQHGTPPVCKDSPTRDPYAQGNAPIGGGHNATDGPGTYTPPSEAASQQPPKHAYTPPPAPVASTPSTGGSSSGGGPSSQPTRDPAPAPSAEPSAPPSSAPATGTSCAPGVTSC